MDAMKHLMLQKSIKDNAEELNSTVKDLYQWEKNIKNKEKQLKNLENESKLVTTTPVRSHMDLPSKTLETTASDKNVGLSVNGNTDIGSSEEKLSHQEVELSSKEKAMRLKEKGNQFAKANDYQNAIKLYTNAILMNDKDAVFYTNRSLCYFKLARYDECIADCKKAIGLDSKAVKAYYRCMQVNEKLENYKEALQDCVKLLKIDPKNITAKNNYLRINQIIAKNEEAKSLKDKKFCELEAVGPVFTKMTSNMKEIPAIDKKPHLRSKKPLKTIKIEEVINTELGTRFTNNLQISDELIDEIFNGFDSHQPSFTEPKKPKMSLEICANKQSGEKLPTEQENSHNSTVINTKLNKISSTIVQESKSSETLCSDTYEFKPTKSTSTPSIVSDSMISSNPTKGTAVTNKLVSKVESKELKTEKENSNNLITCLTNNSIELIAPTTTIEFYTNWRELCLEKKYCYLKSIAAKNITTILGAELTSEILSEIITILHDFYIPNKCAIGPTLLSICTHPEIGILSMLLSNEEKYAMTNILRSIEQNEHDFKNMVDIKRVFDI